MDSDPRVLVVAVDDALIGPLCEGLDQLGWSTMTARTPDAAVQALKDLAIDAAIVESRGLEGRAVMTRLREAAAPRYLPILMIGNDGANDADLTMSSAPHPAQAALRLEQLTRAGIAEEEFRLRQATFAAHGVTLNAPDLGETPLQILTAGAADRRFLAMSNALSAAGAEVVAAPTPYTAFDYLHERAFDAAVLWGAGACAGPVDRFGNEAKYASLSYSLGALPARRDRGRAGRSVPAGLCRCGGGRNS